MMFQMVLFMLQLGFLLVVFKHHYYYYKVKVNGLNDTQMI